MTGYELGPELLAAMQRELKIAKGLLKYIMRQRGITLKPEAKRDLGNAAKAIGVSVEELKEFARPLVQEMVDEQFGKTKQ
jgi:hypothetical protein